MSSNKAKICEHKSHKRLTKALPGCRFCGTHNKFNILHRALLQFKVEGDTFGVFTARAAIEDESCNKLQPKKSCPVQNKGSDCTTWSQWVDAMKPYLPLFLAMLDAPSKGESKKIKDVMLRAEKVASLLQPSHTKIRLMDGHGRVVLLILQAIIKRHGAARANSLTIELVDIDAGVSAYHTSFYPRSLIDQGRLVVACQDVMAKHEENVLLYLNFCGITASLPAVKRYLKWASQHPTVCVVVSWSVARAARKKNTLGALSAVIRDAGCSLELVKTDRTDFKTYFLRHNKLANQ
jgi:hypothetical protein